MTGKVSKCVTGAVAVALVAAFILTLSWGSVSEQQRSKRCEPVWGTVIAHGLERTVVSSGKRGQRRVYRPQVEYGYQYGGSSYVGTKYSAHQVEVEPGWSPEVTRVSGGAPQCVVYVDPADPTFSVLEPSTLATQAKTLAIPIFLVVVSASLGIAALVLSRRQ